MADRRVELRGGMEKAAAEEDLDALTKDEKIFWNDTEKAAVSEFVWKQFLKHPEISITPLIDKAQKSVITPNRQRKSVNSGNSPYVTEHLKKRLSELLEMEEDYKRAIADAEHLKTQLQKEREENAAVRITDHLKAASAPDLLHALLTKGGTYAAMMMEQLAALETRMAQCESAVRETAPKHHPAPNGNGHKKPVDKVSIIIIGAPNKDAINKQLRLLKEWVDWKFIEAGKPVGKADYLFIGPLCGNTGQFIKQLQSQGWDKSKIRNMKGGVSNLVHQIETIIS